MMLPTTPIKSTEKKDNLMVVVHKKITPAKEEPDERLMSYSIITTSCNSSKARVTEDKWSTTKSEKNPKLVKATTSGYQLEPSDDDTSDHKCNVDVVYQSSLANGAKCEGVYKPIFESSWPPPEYVGKKINCTMEPMPPEVEFSDILVDKEIDEFERDYLPEEDDCAHRGKLSRNCNSS